VGVSLSDSEDGGAVEIPSVLCEGSEGFLDLDGSLIVNRLSIALICYVALGALTWATITEPKLRMGTLLILGLFAVKSVLRRGEVIHPGKESEPE